MTARPRDRSLTHYVKDLDGAEYFVRLVLIQPGEAWTSTLPNMGRTEETRTALIASGEWEWLRDGNVNYTNQPIRVFEGGESLQHGLPTGQFWESHLRLETLIPIEQLQ